MVTFHNLCHELSQQFNGLPINQYCLHSCGIDPGFGSSKTAIVLTEHNKEIGKIRILYAEEFEHPNPAVIADKCHQIYRTYKNTWFSVDGSNRGFVNQLKSIFNESLEWEKEDCTPENMKIIPINFSTEHRQLLSHLYLLLNKELLAVPSSNDKLITALRTATANEYSLDKEDMSYDDLLDALRLTVRAYRIKTKE